MNKKEQDFSNVLPRKEREFLSILPGCPTGVQVYDGDIVFALKQYKRKVKQYKHIKELYDRREYIKPSISKKLTKNTAIHKQKMELKNV